MSNHKPPLIISGLDARQEHWIFLNDMNGKHCVRMRNILYLKGDGDYTHFYLIKPLKTIKKPEIVMSHNIGYYEGLLEYPFARANQSFIFNLLHLDTITRSNEVVLNYDHVDAIIITDTFRNEVYAKLQLG